MPSRGAACVADGRDLKRDHRSGGTTAITAPVGPDFFAAGVAEDRAAWHVAEDDGGRVMGFQWIEPRDGDLPSEAADIATFTRIGHTGLGVGSMLFEATKSAARALEYRWINAAIRADNTGGLIYYQSRGFEDYGRIEGHRLANGLIVDKVLKRYDL